MGTRGLTLADLAPGAAEEATPARKTPARGMTLEDFLPKAKEVVPEPMSGKNTLQVTVPLPGNWPTYDTGLPIGESTARGLAGAGKRFVDLQNRSKQAMNSLADGWFPGNQREIDEAVTRDAPLMATTAGMVGNMAPDAIASALFPVKAVAESGLLGMAQGASQPVTSADTNGTAVNTVLGGLGGAGGHMVMNGASNLAGKALHALPEAIPAAVRRVGDKVGIDLPVASWGDPEKRRLYELAKANKVPITIGDLDPTSGWAGVENANRNFWSGRSGDMQKQQDAMRGVLGNLEDSLTSGVPGSEGARISEGIKAGYNAARKTSSDKFNLVSDIAGRSPGLTPIKPTQTKVATDAAIADYPELFDEFKSSPTISKMMGLAEDTGPQAGLILNPKTNKPFQYPQELGFDDAQFLRKRLGAWYDKLNTQHKNGTLPAGLDGEAVKHAASIFSAFNKDLDAWGSQPGNAVLNNAWKDARGFFKENVLPYRDPSKLASKSTLVRNIVNGNVDTDAIANKALPTQNSSIAGDIMELANADGKAAMKSALARKLIDPSVSPDLQGLGNASLLRNTTKQANASGKVFTPAELQQIEDARDLASLTRRSAEAGTTPPATGARTLPFMASSAMAGTAGTAYMGLGMLGDSLDPAARIALAGIAAPAGALSIMKGLNRYAGSGLGQNIHFADPKLRGALGLAQEYAKRAGRGLGEPLVNEYTTGALGHRE